MQRINAKSRSIFFAIWIASFPYSECCAQQDDIAALSKLLRPVIDETTIAIAHLDVQKVTQELLLKKAKSLLWVREPNDPSVERTIKLIVQIKDQIKQCGGRYVVVTASLYDLEHAAVVAIPTDPKHETGGLEKSLSQFAGLGFQVKKLNPSLLILARKQTLTRIENLELAPRHDIHQILQKSLKGIASVNFTPSRDHLKVIRELTPKMAQPYSAFKGELIADGIEFASVRLNQFEPLDIGIRIESKSDQAATNLKNAILGARDSIKPTAPESIFIKGIVAQLALEKVDRGLSLNVGQREEAFWVAIKPFFEAAQKRVNAGELTNRLKKVILGLHNFHDANRMFPDLGRLKDKGKPGLSWRVHILPYIGEPGLYEQFNLDEPWDSEHNKKLISRIPKIFQPTDKNLAPGQTKIVMPRGKKFFAKPYVEKQDAPKAEMIGRRMREILDGTSNSIAIVPVANEHAVIWTKPEDWIPDEKKLLSSLADQGQKTLTFATADGAVHRVELKSLTPKKLMALLTIAAGDIFPSPKPISSTE